MNIKEQVKKNVSDDSKPVNVALRAALANNGKSNKTNKE